MRKTNNKSIIKWVLSISILVAIPIGVWLWSMNSFSSIFETETKFLDMKETSSISSICFPKSTKLVSSHIVSEWDNYKLSVVATMDRADVKQFIHSLPDLSEGKVSRSDDFGLRQSVWLSRNGKYLRPATDQPFIAVNIEHNQRFLQMLILTGNKRAQVYIILEES